MAKPFRSRKEIRALELNYVQWKKRQEQKYCRKISIFGRSGRRPKIGSVIKSGGRSILVFWSVAIPKSNWQDIKWRVIGYHPVSFLNTPDLKLIEQWRKSGGLPDFSKPPEPGNHYEIPKGFHGGVWVEPDGKRYPRFL